jgi:hypothetical protein
MGIIHIGKCFFVSRDAWLYHMLMLNFFAGPVQFEISLPWQAVVLVYIIGAAACALVAFVLWKSIKLVSTTRTQNTQKSQKPLVPSGRNYITGLLIDLSAIIAIVYSLNYLGLFGDWDNDVWHFTMQVIVVAFIAIRLLSRLVLRLSPAEKWLKAGIYTRNQFAIVILADVALVALLFMLVSPG